MKTKFFSAAVGNAIAVFSTAFLVAVITVSMYVTSSGFASSGTFCANIEDPAQTSDVTDQNLLGAESSVHAKTALSPTFHVVDPSDIY